MTTTTTGRIRLSDNTVAILEKFAKINKSLAIKPGNVIRTKRGQDIYAAAKVEETFPCEAWIWDLGQFLQFATMFKDPEFDFQDKCVRICGDRSSVRFHYAAPDLLKDLPERDVVFSEDVFLRFRLPKNVFDEIVKAARYLGLNTVVVRGQDGCLSIGVCDIEDPTKNSYTSIVGDTDFTGAFSCSMSQLELVSCNYDVMLRWHVAETKHGRSTLCVAEFLSTDIDLKYYMPMAKVVD